MKILSVLLRVCLPIAAFILVGLCAGLVRQRFIATFFRDAAPGPAPAALPAAAALPTRAPVAQVRVLLIDGLDLPTSLQLPAFNQLCARGIDLEVDVGFPTVSLPVQGVLWTGRTQGQTGLLYRIAALGTPPAGAAPAQVPGSVAVVEDQPFIARSFGFARVEPPAPAPRAWSGAGFAASALGAVTSDARLVFVHVLGVDKAGHKAGAHAPAYALAARTADQQLAALLERAPPTPDRQWFVLSDHGHRGAGGHGGASAEVRIVRACLAGGQTALSSATPAATGATRDRVHLVDVARALFEALALPSTGPGRPLSVARAAPARDATLPPLPRLRFLLAAAIAVLVAARTRRTPAALAWPALSTLSILIFLGLPDLSNPAVYPPLGRDLLLAGAPGYLLLAYQIARARTWQAAAHHLVPALGLALAALIACGGLPALLSADAGPPLERFTTGWASAFLVVLRGGAFTSAIALATLAARAAVKAARGG